MSAKKTPTNGDNCGVAVLNDPEKRTYRTHHDPRAGDLSTTVALAVTAVNEENGGAEFTLAEFVDPDALDSLFAAPQDGGRTVGHVTFAIGEYDVTVYADDEIVVGRRGE